MRRAFAVRWRTAMRHHAVREKARSKILLNYHLRIDQITYNTRTPRRPEVFMRNF